MIVLADKEGSGKKILMSNAVSEEQYLVRHSSTVSLLAMGYMSHSAVQSLVFEPYSCVGVRVSSHVHMCFNAEFPRAFSIFLLA
ncbi:unnamed protein product [Pieris macdunnoughi]|uniref:Uncharacterized protein n=1 Tax=Pieris macdunnoughi TaxID=345717 RepID=A0A821US72_9NEOP|nr:unnamed protein product [Pieris macdunnoughi]